MMMMMMSVLCALKCVDFCTKCLVSIIVLIMASLKNFISMKIKERQSFQLVLNKIANTVC